MKPQPSPLFSTPVGGESLSRVAPERGDIGGDWRIDMPPEDNPNDDVPADRLVVAIYELVSAFDIRYPESIHARAKLHEFASAIIDEAVRRAIEP